MIRAVRGTYDVLPPGVEIWQAVEALIVGDQEMNSATPVLRDMATKEQRNVREEELV